MIVATKFQDRTEGFFVVSWPFGNRWLLPQIPKRPKRAAACPATGPGEYAWVDSGDRSYRADGEIYVTGRVKDIIIKGGRNLYPHEVEELAARVEGIRKGCIVAFRLKDEATGTESWLSSRRLANAMRRGARLSLPR